MRARDVAGPGWVVFLLALAPLAACSLPLGVGGEIVTQDRAVVPCDITLWKDRIGPLDGDGTAIATARVESGAPFEADLVAQADLPDSDSPWIWFTVECKGYHVRVRGFEWAPRDVLWQPMLDLGRVWVPKREPDTTTGPPEETAEQQAIREAVFSYQVQFLTQDDPELVVCLELAGDDAARDPADELFARLEGNPMVRKVSECRVGEDGGVRDTRSGREAVIAGVAGIRMLGPAEARVQGHLYWSPSRSAPPVYRVVQEQGRWVTLGPILLGAP